MVQIHPYKNHLLIDISNWKIWLSSCVVRIDPINLVLLWSVADEAIVVVFFFNRFADLNWIWTDLHLGLNKVTDLISVLVSDQISSGIASGSDQCYNNAEATRKCDEDIWSVLNIVGAWSIILQDRTRSTFPLRRSSESPLKGKSLCMRVRTGCIYLGLAWSHGFLLEEDCIAKLRAEIHL